MSNELNIEHQGDAMIVRFARPEIRNPLSVVVLDHLHAIADDLSSNNDLKKLIFTGSGDSFASGADLREIASVTSENAHEFARYGQSLMAKVSALSQTTMAAINGWCFGGALDLALSCDVRIASPKAKFAHPGAGLGIITGWGGTQRLPRLIGQANALEMFFTASPLDSDAAFRIGLVDLVADDIFRNELLNLELPEL